jgi:type I restriction enzyme S subunit
VINDLKPYPVMKESGVSWLGKVPSHWAVAALRHRYSQCLGKTLDSKRIRGADPVPYLRNIDVQWDHINTYDLPVMDIAAGEYSRYLVQPGDLLVCEGGDVGRAAMWKGSLSLCGYQKALHRLRPLAKESDNPRFLMFVLIAASAAGAFQDGHESTIAHLTGDKLRAHRFPFPSAIEQAAIVQFLDHADRLIRRNVGAKRRLIKLLEEQKQAIVQRAVTRGLDSNVRLKPSGAEWLGDVPEHWDVRRGKYYFREVDERSPAGSEELLSVSHKTGVTPRSEKTITMFMAESYVGHKLCRSGDIVVNTMSGWMAAVGVAKQLGIVSPSYGVYRARQVDKFRTQYLDFLLRTELYRGEYVRSSRGITTSRLRLYPDDFLRIVFINPPLEEQDAILRWIEKGTGELRRSIAAANQELGLLNEYRARLVTDVVTGKLDVRAAAAELPAIEEEPEALEPSDDSELDEASLDEEAEIEDVAT